MFQGFEETQVYTGDSFFTLSYAGQIGLAALSVFLSAFFIWLAVRITRKSGRLVRIIASLVLFVLFVWLTPQVYYAYYIMVFDDLPVQWVIKTPPSPAELGRLLIFAGSDNLSAHSKGILGWLILLIPQIVPQHRKKPR